MSWRPEGWNELRIKYSENGEYCHTGGERDTFIETEHYHWQDGFEAGADAYW